MAFSGGPFSCFPLFLFPHVTRACQGVVFHTTGIVRELMEKTKTRTGLAVTADFMDKVYEVELPGHPAIS